MASIKISHAHQLSVEEAKRRINAAFGGYSAKYKLTQHWEGNRLIVGGPADGRVVDVDHDRVAARARAHLGDARTHGACTDDADALDLHVP